MIHPDTAFYFANEALILANRINYKMGIANYHYREFIKTEGGYIVMKDGSHVPVSIRKKTTAIKMLSGL